MVLSMKKGAGRQITRRFKSRHKTTKI